MVCPFQFVPVHSKLFRAYPKSQAWILKCSNDWSLQFSLAVAQLTNIGMSFKFNLESKVPNVSYMKQVPESKSNWDVGIMFMHSVAFSMETIPCLSTWAIIMPMQSWLKLNFCFAFDSNLLVLIAKQIS